MKLLPAALLTLLSAASSILPSAAAEKESISGVARKLTAKADKAVDKSGTLGKRSDLDGIIRKLGHGVLAKKVAEILIDMIDADGNATICDGEADDAVALLGEEVVKYLFNCALTCETETSPQELAVRLTYLFDNVSDAERQAFLGVIIIVGGGLVPFVSPN